MSKNTMKDVFVKAKLIRGSDRIDNCRVSIRRTGGRTEEVECSVYTIYDEKPDTKQILRMLESECNTMITTTHDYKEKALIAKIYENFVKVVKVHQ